MNESNLPQVSEPLSAKPLSAELPSEPPSAEPPSAEPLSAEVSLKLGFEPPHSQPPNSQPLSAESLRDESLNSEPLRDLPSSTHDIPMAVRETPSPVPRVKDSSPWLFWGFGSVGAIALLGTGLFFALRPPSAATPSAATANISAQPASSRGTPSLNNPSLNNPSLNNPSLNNPSATSPSPPLLNHLPYDEAPRGELTPITPSGDILMRKVAAAKFMEMQEAARAAGVSLIPISGFRSQEDQSHVFFDVKAQRGQDTTTRSEVSAPPGYSEHHTGYAVDIGDGDRPDLNLQIDFETDQAFQWLKENAGFYSFEMSFPKNNTQGVSYEPWHWRFVGDRNSLETFYRARAAMPSSAPSSAPVKAK